MDRRSGIVFAEVDPQQVGTRRDLQLGEHLPQVIVDRARAKEELCADLAVRHSSRHEVRDLQFLRGELIAAGRIAAARRRLSASPQFGARPLFPRGER
jgi:hypothetical protein